MSNNDTSSPDNDETSPANGDDKQAMQINEDTIEDPKEPESDDESLPGRDGIDENDQPFSINDNTVGDEK